MGVLQSEAPLLDLELLAELHEMETLRPRLLSTLAEKFRAARPTQLSEMLQAAHAGEIERAKSLAHALKGAAASLGLARFAAATESIERNGTPIDDLRAGELRALLQQSLDALDGYVAEFSCR